MEFRLIAVGTYTVQLQVLPTIKILDVYLTATGQRVLPVDSIINEALHQVLDSND